MGDALLQAHGITKRYGGSDALTAVDLEIRAGEVVALMGENGAGKSTMAKIIAGVEQPDSGTLEWDGIPTTFRDTRDATRAGIAIVLQELSLIPDLSVAENIFLAHQDAYRGGWWLDRRNINRATRDLARRLGWDLPLDPEQKVSDLTVAEQQMVEILRALSLDARLVILDEPTATLSAHEVEILFNLVRRLRAQGTSFLIVTHRLEEVFALSDRITVYRDGKLSGVFETAKTNQGELIRAMVGRDLGDLFQIRQRREPGEPVLTVRRLILANRRQGPEASFAVHRGEIVGIAGLVGSGRSELLETIFGARRADSGTVTLNGKRITSIGGAVKAGMGMAPEERKSQALLLDEPIYRNMTLASFAGYARAGFTDTGKERAAAEETAASLELRPRGDVNRPIRTLSGGNQQKVVVGRWLLGGTKLLLLDEPTRGVDVGARAELYQVIHDLAAGGVGVLLVSSEVPEVLGLADRVLVMREGHLIHEAPASEIDEATVLDLVMAGSLMEGEPA